jgi:hypothetical protein
MMNRTILALAAALTLAAGAASTAKAVEFDVGPHRHGYYESYDRYRNNCRVIIDHRTNRFGEDVTVRRRVCD